MGIAEINETIDSCKFCFMCRHACPTFLATKLDSHTPRGYALLLAEIRDGVTKWSGSVVDRFYQCSQCGLCREDCAYHWPEDELVRNAREEIIKSELVPARVRALADSFGKPSIANAKSMKTEILYFPGWLTRETTPEIANSVCEILDSVKAKWMMPDGDISSGIELYELGYTDKVRETSTLLHEYIRRLNPKILLTGCAHSLKAFRNLFPQLGLLMPSGIQILHTSQFFESLISDGKLKLRKGSDTRRIGYHDPCNLGRRLKIFDEPRSLVARIAGSSPLELFHNRENAECCGAGSVMNITDPGIAERVAARRLESAAEEKIELLITACQNCKTLLSRTAHAMGLLIKVKDIAEYVREHMEAGK